MSTGARWPLRQALVQAQALVRLLAPYCERIEIAGSIRRKAPDVGDVELVLLPRREQRPGRGQGGIFEDAPRMDVVNLAWEELDRVTAAGKLPEKLRGGEKMRTYPATTGPTGEALTLQVDVFAVLDPRAWGAILAIRTGPADWSKIAAGVLLRKRGLYMEGGLVHRNSGVVVPCPEEADFLRACGLSPTLRPEDRR